MAASCLSCGVIRPSAIAVSTQSRSVSSTGRSVTPSSDLAFLLSPIVSGLAQPSIDCDKRKRLFLGEVFRSVCPEPVLATFCSVFGWRK